MKMLLKSSGEDLSSPAQLEAEQVEQVGPGDLPVRLTVFGP